MTTSDDTRLFRFTLAILCLTLLLGGAGDLHYLLGAVVQLASALLLGAAVLAPGRPSRLMPACTLALILAAIALPLVQLIPLPAAIGADIPGQKIALETFRGVGLPVDVRPLTVDRGYTIQAALELLPALAMFVAATRLRWRQQRVLLALVVLIAAISAAIGGFQRATGTMLLFDTTQVANARGLFVNRNHQATFLLIAILLLPVALPVIAPELRGQMRRALTIAGVLLLAGGVIATTSRAGLGVLPFAIAGAALLTLDAKIRPLPLIAGATTLVVAAWGALQLPAVRLILTRYAQGDERHFYWEDTLPAIKGFWPWGSGIGTFTRVFPTYEVDARIDRQTVNAAHNDYVQLLLEGGLPAALLIGSGLILFLLAMVRLFRSGASLPEGKMGWAAAGGILVILLHSVVDYPLRMMSLMAVFGLLAAVLMRAADGGRGMTTGRAGDDA